jgi:hypothetical protein
VERRVIPVCRDRVEFGEVEIVSLAQGATDDWFLLHQGCGGDIARKELSKRGRGDSNGRPLDEQITARQTTGAVSVEEMTNRDAVIHLDASLCFSTSSRDWLALPDQLQDRGDHIKTGIFGWHSSRVFQLRPRVECA